MKDRNDIRRLRSEERRVGLGSGDPYRLRVHREVDLDAPPDLRDHALLVRVARAHAATLLDTESKICGLVTGRADRGVPVSKKTAGAQVQRIVLPLHVLDEQGEPLARAPIELGYDRVFVRVGEAQRADSGLQQLMVVLRLCALRYDPKKRRADWLMAKSRIPSGPCSTAA